jgi:hypothetical protein
LQQFELVDPAAVVAFELDLQHLARVAALHAFEQRGQWQHLAGLHGGACTVVIAILTRLDGRGQQPGHQQAQAQQRQAASGRSAGTSHEPIVDNAS